MDISLEDIAQQKELLRLHRQTLAHFLQQQAALGTAFTPPAVANGIRETREQIRHVKQTLRDWGVAAEDMPDDTPTRRNELETPRHYSFGQAADASDSDREPVDADDRFSAPVREHMATLNRKVERLTQEQFRVIQMLSGLRRVRISGCAGSGKTLVAAEKALRLARAGLRTLFLCHNPLLAEHVRQLVAGAGVKVIAFSAWVAELAGVSPSFGLEHWTNYEEPDGQTLNSAFDRLVERGAHFDAIIVDEGQDFRDEWWTLVEAALTHAEAGIVYIFHDDQQALLPHRASYPINDPLINLSRNCRNAGRVYELMRFFHPESPIAEDDLKELGHVLIQSYVPAEEQAALEDVVRQMHSRGLGENCVLLLGGTHSLEATSLLGAKLSIPTEQRWQETIQQIFAHWVYLQDPRGVVFPSEQQAPPQSMLDELSSDALPNPHDIALVCQVAGLFKIDPGIRRAIKQNPHRRKGMRWATHNHRLQLYRPGMALTLPIWAAETLIHFEGEDWAAGLPAPTIRTLQPYYEQSVQHSIPIYNVADYKGLEADTIILLIGGRVAAIEQQIYVGVSRARFLLAILVDRSTSALFPYIHNSLNLPIEA